MQPVNGQYMPPKFDNLETLDDAALAELHKKAAEEIERRAKKRRDDRIAQIQALMAEEGLKPEDLRKKPAPKGATYKTGQKYQNPDNKDQVWAGKGKKPGWLRDLEKKGGKPVEVG